MVQILPGIAEKLMQGFGIERNHKNIYKSKKQKKAHHLLSMQGFGMLRNHKNIYKSKKEKKVLPWQYLLPVIAEKPISSSSFSDIHILKKMVNFYAFILQKYNGIGVINYIN